MWWNEVLRLIRKAVFIGCYTVIHIEFEGKAIVFVLILQASWMTTGDENSIVILLVAAVLWFCQLTLTTTRNQESTSFA
jgi:hypothetical protein